MFTQHFLIEALIDAGTSGYIFKDDHVSIRQPAKIAGIIATSGIYFSEEAYQDLHGKPHVSNLTLRQLETLSLYPSPLDGDTAVLANKEGITGSTLEIYFSTSIFARVSVRAQPRS